MIKSKYIFNALNAIYALSNGVIDACNDISITVKEFEDEFKSKGINIKSYPLNEINNIKNNVDVILVFFPQVEIEYCISKPEYRWYEVTDYNKESVDKEITGLEESNYMNVLNGDIPEIYVSSARVIPTALTKDSDETYIFIGVNGWLIEDVRGCYNEENIEPLFYKKNKDFYNLEESFKHALRFLMDNCFSFDI